MLGVDGVDGVVGGVVVVVDGVVVGAPVVEPSDVAVGVWGVVHLELHLLHLKSDSVCAASNPIDAPEVAVSLGVSLDAPPHPATKIGTTSVNVPKNR